MNNLSKTEEANLSRLLAAAANGDMAARDEFVEQIYRELHKRASRLLSLEHQEHTLQTTALLNEALMHFLGDNLLQANDRNHFLNTAAQQMRRLLVDRARARSTNKRKGLKVSIEDAGNVSLERSDELVSLDDALKMFTEVDAEAAKIVELKYFGGYTDEETAAIVGTNVAKIRRDWEYARAWLHDYLS